MRLAPPSQALLDVIGTPIGYVDIIDGPSCEVGFSLNPIKAVKGTVRSAKRAVSGTVRSVNRVKRKTIDKVPVVRDIAKAYSQAISFSTTPYRLGAGFITGAITGGPKGAVAGLKHEAAVTKRQTSRFVQNPVVRYGTKGAALIFPPMVPVAAGIEAANQAIAAIEQKDPIKAAFAFTTIANTAVAANGGDADAARAIKAIKAVKDGTLKAKEAASHIQEGAKAMKLGARFTIPKGAKALNVAKAADKLLSNAKGKAGKVAAVNAQAIVKQTVAAAKAGDSGAKKAAVALAKVNAAQNKKAGIVPAKKAIGSRVSLATAVSQVKKALRLGKGKKLKNVFIVDTTGRVYRGNVTTQ